MAIGVLSATCVRTPSGRYDLKFRNGVEIPNPPDITIAAIPDFTLTAGQSFSQNFNVYASGVDLPGATYAIEAVSGTIASLDLSFSTSTLSGSTPDAGTAIVRLAITKSGYTIRGNNFSLVVNAAPVTDNVAPAKPFGLSVVNISATRNDITLDWPSDVRTATVDPTDPVKIVLERNVDGGAYSLLTTLTASQSQPTPALSFSAIGTMSSPLGSHSGPDITLTASDGVVSSTSDVMAFYGGLVSGDFEIVCEMPDIISGYSWSTAGPCIRQNRTPMCPAVVVTERTNTNAAGAPMLMRASQGAALTYTTDANVAVGTPVKIKRVGNLFTYQVWDATALQWLTIGSGTVVMTDPVEAGVHVARSSAGAAITVVQPQLRINRLGTATHSDTTVTAGHVYGYRAKSRDSATVPNDSGYCASAFATTPSANVIRFSPGYYEAFNTILRDENASTEIPRYIGWINELANEPTVRGVKIFVQWRALEGNTAGDYTTGIARIRQLRDACAAVNKKLWLSFLHVVFGGTAADLTLYFPGYIVNSVGGSYGITVMSNGKTSRVWQQATMDRVIAQCIAYANADNGHGVAFKDDPVIECMQIDETSIAVATGVDGMSQANVLTQYQRWMVALRAAAPNLPLRLTLNYLGDDDQTWDAINTAVANKIMVGGPDTIINQGIQGNVVFTGTPTSASGRTQTRTVIDRRGVVPWVGEVQTPSIGGHKGNWTMEQLVDGMNNGYTYTYNSVLRTARAVQPQYIHITRQEGSTVGINWNSPRVSDGAESILSYIRRTNGAVYSTARPSAYA